MTDFKLKLIIWDFDGVIADSEILWLENRRRMINNKFGLNWDIHQTNLNIGGMSDKTRKQSLSALGYATEDKFWEEALAADYKTMAKGIPLMPGVTDIFELSDYKQCIATGGSRSKTKEKLQNARITQYFSDNRVFTADMVKNGKPAPDLFLLAAKEMNEQPQNCLVIEDSLPGIKAAQNAGMKVAVFVGSKMNNTPEYISKVKELGVQDIFDNMKQLKSFILRNPS